MDRQEIFADDVQPRRRQEMVDVGDAAGEQFPDRIMPSAAVPSAIAVSASSKVGQVSGSMSDTRVGAGDVRICARLPPW